MQARIGLFPAPFIKLGIQIVDIAEGAGQKEILPDIAERTFDLALGLRPIRFAGPRDGAVMVEKCNQ